MQYLLSIYETISEKVFIKNLCTIKYWEYNILKFNNQNNTFMKYLD